MERPNQEQVNAAIAILTHHNSQYGGAATETMKQQCVYSILSALGGPGDVSAEFAMAVGYSKSGIDADAVNAVIISETTADIIGIGAGRYVLETEMALRNAAEFEAIVVNMILDASPSGASITLNDEVASLLLIDAGRYVLENNDVKNNASGDANPDPAKTDNESAPPTTAPDTATSDSGSNAPAPIPDTTTSEPLSETVSEDKAIKDDGYTAAELKILTVDQLLALSIENKIDLGGVTLKDDIIAAIVAS